MSKSVPSNVGPAAEAILGSRADAAQLKRVFERHNIPMVMVDDQRRYAEVNSAARLAFRQNLEEMRGSAVDELTPAHRRPVLEAAWARFLATGHATGVYVVEADGNRYELAYWALSHALPGLHLIAFAPTGWPNHEPGVIEADDGDQPLAPLTPREREVLQLAAEGGSARRIAEHLFVSPSTVQTHFQNIYEKLGVQNRAAAVAKGLRLGVIH